MRFQYIMLKDKSCFIQTDDKILIKNQWKNKNNINDIDMKAALFESKNVAEEHMKL